jgi:hypothetical protein
MDGKDDVGDDGTFSQFGEPVGSVAAAAGADAGGLCAVCAPASAEDVGAGRDCYVVQFVFNGTRGRGRETGGDDFTCGGATGGAGGAGAGVETGASVLLR